MLITIIEVAAVVLVLYGIINEEKLIAWEDKFKVKVKERLNVK